MKYEAGITDIIAPYAPRWTGEFIEADSKVEAERQFEQKGFYRNPVVRIVNDLPFEIVQPPEPRPLRPGLTYVIDNEATRKVRAFTDDTISGCMAGTGCETPGHYISSHRWGYLSTGAKDEFEAWDRAANSLPEPPMQGRSYFAAGEVYELRAIHPLLLDLYFVGQHRSFWVCLRDFKDHFVLLPLVDGTDVH
jgi:hypothetical protein